MYGVHKRQLDFFGHVMRKNGLESPQSSGDWKRRGYENDRMTKTDEITSGQPVNVLER